MATRDGLTLTRCDVCNVRSWCAVEGTAMCARCCPAAVEAAREDHARMVKVRAMEWEARRLLAGANMDPNDGILEDGTDVWLPPEAPPLAA